MFARLAGMRLNVQINKERKSVATNRQGYTLGWNWITHPHEGDIWYPVWINETYFLMDGKPRNLDDLGQLIIKPAVIPEREKVHTCRRGDIVIHRGKKCGEVVKC